MFEDLLHRFVDYGYDMLNVSNLSSIVISGPCGLYFMPQVKYDCDLKYVLENLNRDGISVLLHNADDATIGQCTIRFYTKQYTVLELPLTDCFIHYGELCNIRLLDRLMNFLGPKEDKRRIESPQIPHSGIGRPSPGGSPHTV